MSQDEISREMERLIAHFREAAIQVKAPYPAISHAFLALAIGIAKDMNVTKEQVLDAVGKYYDKVHMLKPDEAPGMKPVTFVSSQGN